MSGFHSENNFGHILKTWSMLVEEKSRKLVEAERMAAFGEAIAGLAHTIKNISGGLSGGTFVLEKGIELHHDQYLAQGWTMIKGNVEKLVSLSLDLLNYGKSSEIHPAWCHPNQPAQEVFDLMQPQAQSHGVSLELSLSESLVQVYMDMEAIGRCLQNLVTNAIDACLDEADSPGDVPCQKCNPPDPAGAGVGGHISD